MIKTNKNIAILDSNILVDYILQRGGAMSHLKLQKLLFYVQAYHLAYFESPIIKDDFEAWVHGPVSRKIYNSARDISILHKEIIYFQGIGEIDPTITLKSSLTDVQLSLVDDVIDELKDLTGLQLENMTHSEYPWIFARQGYAPGERCTNTIPHNIIIDFYKKQLYG